MNEAQERFGKSKESVHKKVQSTPNPMVQDFIRQAPVQFRGLEW